MGEAGTGDGEPGTTADESAEGRAEPGGESGAPGSDSGAELGTGAPTTEESAGNGTGPGDVDGLLDGTIEPRFAIDATTPPDEVFMPLEFSVAAYRFGHSMVRASYDWNQNFGHPRVAIPPGPFPTQPAASFELL